MAEPERSHPGVERAERAAAMLAAAGMPRMPARVMMALVGSPDEGYSAAELASRLGVSPAAVSGAVRYLESMRMVHRLSRPGERVARFDLIDDGWRSMVVSQTPMYGRLADDIDAIADDNADAPASVERAREIAGFLRYLEKRMPELVVEWQESTGRSPS
ncbi:MULTISPECIES: helix-turn-helix domain-containing protein [unclassified Microbacterium]|uniref:GbsR/MarR family transcriptional regulator n=1 Tax=unclassified Microbacterium TaxID=2609290 RepID=UPI001175BFF0|nr:MULTISPECIES: helix-turn-helix domain-containing protein [unclassified Microbacterium]TQK20848.1 DNA-binding transcriptional regulator GbsR (MarR family) [Microbacterium sp. SLBN-154]